MTYSIVRRSRLCEWNKQQLCPPTIDFKIDINIKMLNQKQRLYISVTAEKDVYYFKKDDSSYDCQRYNEY